MNRDLYDAIRNGQLILFLGAGASRGCTAADGKELLDGAELAKHLAKIGQFPYDNESLDDVYAAVRSKLQSRLDPELEKLFKNARPSHAYSTLAEYAWRRIYTLNIDDALDSAIRRAHLQDLSVRASKDAIVDQDSFFNRIDLVKLNGSIDKIQDGIIFSSSDYAKATTRSLPWYEQCASDFIRLPTLFIGTKLSEPLLKFHIERYKSINNKSPGRSYVITPHATELQKSALLDFNIEHISGTLDDFVNWLKSEFGVPLKPIDLALASIPQLSELLKSPDARKFASLFDHVIPVKLASLGGGHDSRFESSIRDFYKGFKPTWDDIINEIPANLDVLEYNKDIVVSNFKKNSFVPIIGPAGSGKTTFLMQLCLHISNHKSCEVYFIEQPIDFLLDTLEAIERNSKSQKVFVAIDNPDFMSDQLRDAFYSKRLQKTTILGAERENVWKRKTRTRLGLYSCSPIHISEFTVSDAEKILKKLELYGSWTRLGQLSKKKRTAELVDRAQKQLLIALLEATYGLGYGQIIASDFSSLTGEDERLCFLVVGLITDRKHDAPLALVDRALSYLGILNRESMLSSNLAGIVVERAGKYAVRHPIYIRYILDHLVDPSLTYKALSALLEVFSQYESPVIKHVDKLEAAIYKGLINHAFLRDVLKGHRELVFSLYKSLEKKFEQDGLFWLQYGLALRDFKEHNEALEKLRTARSAYPMEHTQHALGQQLLIVAENLSEKQTSIAYLEEATEILESLDDVIESDDTFPIVTLSEGATKVMRIHLGDDVARRKAGEFASRLKRRCDELAGDDRLRSAYENMFRYAATGTWTDRDE